VESCASPSNVGNSALFYVNPNPNLLSALSVYVIQGIWSHCYGLGRRLRKWTSAFGSMPLLAEPGESWSYSVGFDILGDLVEVVSGVSLGDCLQSKLFFDIRNDRYVLLD
jgi:hypothetical protein